MDILVIFSGRFLFLFIVVENAQFLYLLRERNVIIKFIEYFLIFILFVRFVIKR